MSMHFSEVSMSVKRKLTYYTTKIFTHYYATASSYNKPIIVDETCTSQF